MFILEVSRKTKTSMEHLEAELAEAPERKQFCFKSLFGFHSTQLEKLDKKKFHFPFPSHIHHTKTA